MCVCVCVYSVCGLYSVVYMQFSESKQDSEVHILACMLKCEYYLCKQVRSSDHVCQWSRKLFFEKGAPTV